MPNYEDAGTVFVQQLGEGSGLHRLSFLWTIKSGETSAVLAMREPIFGTLHEYRTAQSAPVGTIYNVYLYDEYGADIFDGLATGLGINAVAGPTLLRAKLSTPGDVRSIVFGGVHTFRATGTALSFGTFDVFYYPDLRPALHTSPFAGGARTTTRVISTDSPYTVLATDEIILADTDTTAITINLPAGTAGRHLKIVNVGSSGNDVTIDPNGTEELYGSGAGTAFTLIDAEVINIDYDVTEGWW